MDILGITGVAAIAVICYLFGMGLKAWDAFCSLLPTVLVLYLGLQFDMRIHCTIYNKTDGFSPFLSLTYENERKLIHDFQFLKMLLRFAASAVHEWDIYFVIHVYVFHNSVSHSFHNKIKLD